MPGLSEDTKGDPTKEVTYQADPNGGRDPDVEPLLPPEDLDAAPSATEDEPQEHATPADVAGSSRR